MIINFQIATIIAFSCGIIGYVFINVLQEPDNLLSGFRRFMVREHEQRHLPAFVFHILCRCEKCFAGQAALWFYLFVAYHTGLYTSQTAHEIIIAVVFHIYSISMAIVIAYISNILINKWQS